MNLRNVLRRHPKPRVVVGSIYFSRLDFEAELSYGATTEDAFWLVPEIGLPGKAKLSEIAGPMHIIGQLSEDDVVLVELKYGRFWYEVVRHELLREWQEVDPAARGLALIAGKYVVYAEPL